MQNTERQDIYARVTGQIVASLEKGVRPWTKPWSGENAAGRITRPLRHNGVPYSGINILMLWGAALEHGFSSPSWMTFKQAQDLNAHVRKGEKGSLVLYANTFTRTEENTDGHEVEREIPFLRGYSVFNVEQIEGLPEHYYAKPEPKFTSGQRVDHAEAFFAATQADIRYHGSRAYYAEPADYIQLPPIETFRDSESFYSTLAHEATHNADRRIMPRRTQVSAPACVHWALIRHNNRVGDRSLLCSLLHPQQKEQPHETTVIE